MIVLGWFLFVLTCLAALHYLASRESVATKFVALLGCVLHGGYIGWTLFGR